MFGQLPKFADLPAFRAPEVGTKAHFKQVRQAGVIVRELLEKALNCQMLGRVPSPYLSNIGWTLTYVKFIIA
jgi:hypothetical protein